MPAMRNARRRLGVWAAAFLMLSLRTASVCAQVPQSAIPVVADPKLGVFVEQLPNDPARLSDFVYEAARSGLFGVVERQTQYGINRYSFVNDFARCAELVKNLYGPGKIAELGRVYYYTPFSLIRYDEDLVRGACVSAEKVEERSARYIVTRGGIRDSVDGAALLPEGTFTSPEQIWTAFGLVRQNATLWSEKERRNDQAADQDLVRALTEGQRVFSVAAINLLHGRLLKAPTFADKRAVLRQETGASVGAALIAQGGLFALDIEPRRAGIMAAAVVPADANELFPAILKALEEPANPLNEQQVAERDRLEKLNPGFGNSIIGSPEPRPGYTHSIIFDAAAFASAMYGPSYASAFVKKYNDHLGKILQQDVTEIFQGGYVMVVAVAPEAVQIIFSLLKDADVPGAKNREGLLNNAAAIISSTKTIPPAVTAELRSRCASANDKTRPFTPLYCDTQLARSGDDDAYQRLVSILMTPPADPVMEQTRNTVAQQMLLRLGSKGIEGLKAVALNTKPAEAKAAMRWLCYLGAVAGPEIVKRARANAGLMPDDKIMWLIADRCENPYPSEIGRFVLLWN